MAETAASKVVMFEAVRSADHRHFSPLSHTGIWDKLGFSAALRHAERCPRKSLVRLDAVRDSAE